MATKHKVTVSVQPTNSRPSSAERRAAQSHSADRDTDAPCTTRIFVMTKTDGSRTLRKSVDCEE